MLQNFCSPDAIVLMLSTEGGYSLGNTKACSEVRDKNFLLLVVFASQNNPGSTFFFSLLTFVSVIYMMHFAN